MIYFEDLVKYKKQISLIEKLRQTKYLTEKLSNNVQDIIKYLWWSFFMILIEAVARRYSVKKVFLEISKNSQENTCSRVAFLIKSQGWGLQLY